ncbi:maleylacetate reductase [Streptomyces misionensis]|uniref:maleylacetate reductase n=1 Tax=Streptomyces misionensis TaxID=67331 RepID=UPI0033D26E52
MTSKRLDDSSAFEFETAATRVVFGRGSAAANVEKEAARLGAQSIMLIAASAESDLAHRLTEQVRDRIVEVFGSVKPHVPHSAAVAAQECAVRSQADLLISIGGGSTTGTAKIIARETGIPILAVPTTYAGSEMTPVWGMTTDGIKETGKDLRVQPRVVIYDPALLVSLPRDLAVASALNATAHALEGLWVPASSPVSDALAVDSVAQLTLGLRKLCTGHSQSEDQLLLGAYLAGVTFAATGSGLHHKICHALGGAFDLPHAATHAVILPHVLQFNSGSIASKMTRLEAALGTGEVIRELRTVWRSAGAPETLAELGMTAEQLDEAIDLVARKLPIDNPRPVSAADVGNILRSAYEGGDA